MFERFIGGRNLLLGMRMYMYMCGYVWIYTTLRRKAIRDAGDSDTPQTFQQHCSEGFNWEPNMDPHYTERRQLLLGPMKQFSVNFSQFFFQFSAPEDLLRHSEE